MEEKKTNKKKVISTVKTVIRFAVGGLVEIFVGAVTNNVVGGVRGTKIAKLGAKAGGFLVGMYIGEQVSDYICNSIDETVEEFDKLKDTIEETEQ